MEKNPPYAWWDSSYLNLQTWGYPTLVRCHEYDEPVVAHFAIMEEVEILFLPGRSRRLAYALPEDVHGGIPKFKEAKIRSLTIPPVDRWPCSLIEPKNGWRWMITPEGFTLIDPRGEIRSPSEMVGATLAAQIRGCGPQVIHHHSRMYLPRHGGRGRNGRKFYLAHIAIKMPTTVSQRQMAFIRHCLREKHTADTEFLRSKWV